MLDAKAIYLRQNEAARSPKVKVRSGLAIARLYLIFLFVCGLAIVVAIFIGGSRRAQTVISYVSSVGLGKNVLHLMDIQNRITRPVSQNIVYCCTKWSPSGGEIIFDTFDGQGTNSLKRIYRMNANGSQMRPLMSLTEPSAQSGVWSPDGRYIAYVTFRFEFVAEVAVLDTQTGESRQITHNHTYAEAPIWSPDGQFIVFTAQQGRANWDICRVNVDGTGYQNLTLAEGSDNLPAISPNGQHITFISNREGKQLLHLMDADGKNLHPLTTVHTLEITPSWSPDGRYILFVSEDQLGKVNISRISADGSDFRPLATISGGETSPVWSPDSQHILFTAANDLGNTDLYTMDADGEHLVKLADANSRETNLAWHPG